MSLLRRSAALGYAEAYYVLGTIYEQGASVPQDYTLAVLNYELAMQFDFLGWPPLKLSNLYAEGNGVERDVTKAKELLELAQQQAPEDSAFREALEKIQQSDAIRL